MNESQCDSTKTAVQTCMCVPAPLSMAVLSVWARSTEQPGPATSKQQSPDSSLVMAYQNYSTTAKSMSSANAVQLSFYFTQN